MFDVSGRFYAFDAPGSRRHRHRKPNRHFPRPLNTKLIFTPTNEVLVCSGGLSVGPGKIIDTTNGAFSLSLDAGDYTVTMPMVTCRSHSAFSFPAPTGPSTSPIC